MIVERLAVQRSGRRQAGIAILRRCICGDQIRCNGLFDGALREDFAHLLLPLPNILLQLPAELGLIDLVGRLGHLGPRALTNAQQFHAGHDRAYLLH